MPLNTWKPVNSWTFGTPVRAIIFFNGFLAQVTDAQIGTALKPVVYDSGELKVRSATEGTPVVYDSGFLRTIAAGETLLI